jgi:hypothetical protein
LLKKDKPIHLLVYPETAIPLLNLAVNSDLELTMFDSLLKFYNSSLLTGIVRVHFYSDAEEIPITAKEL